MSAAEPTQTEESHPRNGPGATVREPLEALESHFGFREFLDGQERVVSALLSGRDALVVMPTGGGKSLCYQLPALCMDGVTLVVSPLIALMKDQVDGLRRKGIAATMINSTLTPNEQQERIRQMREGAYKLVYIAPERFRSTSFLRALKQTEGGAPVALFAVDEAHCLSQWGHDFRPDYLRLNRALEALGHPQTAAFTATATPEVREDILKTLALRDPLVSVSGFERPNLSLRVVHCEKRNLKYDRLKQIVAEHRTGIVYCATRKRVEEVADSLASWGVKTAAYHGGMNDSDREHAQNAFLDRTRDVVVATNAFGMGIDRPDVRFVVHFDVPGSVEAYYQEAGRAGRDGEPAVCELLFNYADRRTQEFFIQGSNPGYGTICDVYSTLRRMANEKSEAQLPLRELADAVGAKNDMEVGSALGVLARHGYVERFDIIGERTRGTRLLKPEIGPDQLEIDRDALEEKERRDMGKLDSMIQLAFADTCRQEWILAYFGETSSTPCGSCDACESRADGAGRRRAPSAEEATSVLKVLSGIARASRRLPGGEWEGRYGKGKIVGMLVGSRSQDVLAAGLDQLSTYGLLKSQGSAYVFALLKALEEGGFVHTQPGLYPVMTLTAYGARVMKGTEAYALNWPRAALVQALKGDASSPSKQGREDPGLSLNLSELSFDQALFEKLRDCRNDLAQAADVPAYVVFSNQVLEFFTRLRPTTREAALRIKGVGEVKADRYLAPFLEVIRDHQG